MMKKEFNLSEKMFSLQKLDNLPIKRRSEFLFKEDVKEFIRLLKEEAEKEVTHGGKLRWYHLIEIIDTLAGKDLK